jgi:4-phosphopantoate--beta-alanine ligase
MGKKVISIDLNPLSRTAIASNVTIVDNIARAIPNMVSISKELVNSDRSYLLQQIKNFDNIQNMYESLKMIRKGI